MTKNIHDLIPELNDDVDLKMLDIAKLVDLESRVEEKMKNINVKIKQIGVHHMIGELVI